MGVSALEITKFLRLGTGNGYGNGHGNGYGYGDGNGYGHGNGYGNGYGYGHGYGNGYGYGDGNGYGHGDGDGNGYGDGDGNGYGYGHGNGDGDGNGYGDGDGNGNGYGDGNGYGHGDGDGNFIRRINGHGVYEVDGVPTVITTINGTVAKGFLLERNVYMVPCYIVAHAGYFAHGETLHKAREALEEKIYENMDTEETIAKFIEAFPEVDKPYPVSDFYIWHNRLTGSCEMGRKSFANSHDIDIQNDKMTVREFVHLTKDAFCGEIIRELAEKIGIEA